MPGPHFFCAAQSHANGEAVYGTVARIRSWLLLEYPSAWRKHALEDSRLLEPSLKDYIRRLPVDRVLLIRQQHQRQEMLRCFFVQSCGNPPSATRHDLNDYEDLRSLSGEIGRPAADLMFAVCTHGRHDKCCAKFGMPLWCAFHELAPANAWQCSHVGGDRFAGNVVVFPYGIFYGRVTPADVPVIVRLSQAGEIWLPGYRGRSCFPRPVQIAEYFLRAESGRLGIDDFRPVQRTDLGSGSRVVFESLVDETIHTVEFTTASQVISARLTCDSIEPSPVAQFELKTYTAVRR